MFSSVDKTSVTDLFLSVTGSTAVHVMYITAVSVSLLARAIEWFAVQSNKQCQRFLVFAKNKKSGLSTRDNRSDKGQAKGVGEVSLDDIVSSPGE